MNLKHCNLYLCLKVKSFNRLTSPRSLNIISSNRQLSVLHTRIRNNCRDLQLDLFNNHVSDTAFCSCGHYIESAEHFFFRCSHYTLLRHKLLNSLRPFHPLNVNLLLFGCTEYDYETKCKIFCLSIRTSKTRNVSTKTDRHHVSIRQSVQLTPSVQHTQTLYS